MNIELMPLVQRRPTVSDLSEAELTAALNAPAIPAEERERRHPHLAWMRRRATEAIQQLERDGILDSAGKLVRPDYLPEDMQPGSKTEC